jgi:hypothetical protein
MITMTVTRCKFVCESKTERENGFEIKLAPVTHGSPENESFFKWTPYGKMEFGTINEEAAKQFKPGKEYYLDITEA